MPRLGIIKPLSQIVPVLLAALLLQSCKSRIEWPESGVPISLAKERASIISELSYEVTLSIPSEKDSSVSGTNTIRFTLERAPQQHLFLDFAGDVGAVMKLNVNGRKIKVRCLNQHILIPWAHLRPGNNEVVVEFISSSEALNRQEEFLFSLFVPDRARSVIPCFDQPDLKARFSLTLGMPEEWTAVSNAAVADEQVDSAGIRWMKFDETKPISTYLFSFAAGKFNRVEGALNGKPAYFYHRETDSSLVAYNTAEIFRLHENAIKWLEDYTGIPYPFDKFDFVLIPSFQYGGMEHPGDIYYRASRILLNPDASEAEKLNRASLIAHETAHMWFGDLVTMKWFDDVWLKEIFANFFAARIVNPEFPEIDHEARFILTHYVRALGVDRSAGSNPIKQELGNLEDAGSLYGDIIYYKAPILMYQLEMLAGAQAFRSGMLTYLHSYKYGNASWEDLVKILDEITPIDLNSWSNEWFFTTYYPKYHASVEAHGIDSLKILIVRNDDQAGKHLLTQRFELMLANQDKLKVVRCDISSDTTILFTDWNSADQKPLALMYDGHFYGEQILGSNEGSAAFMVALNNPSRKVRGAMWISIHENFLNDRLPIGEFWSGLIEAAKNETSPVILSTLLDYMRECYWTFMTPEVRGEASAQLEEILLERSREKGLGRLFYQAFRDMAISGEARDLLLRYWNEGHPNLIINDQEKILLTGALAVRSYSAMDSLISILRAGLKNPDLASRLDFISPALSASTHNWEKFIASLSDDRVRRQENWILESLRLINHPLRSEQSIQLLPSCLQMLEEVKRTGDIFFPRNWLDACISGHQSQKASTFIDKYLEENPDLPGPLRGKVLQATDLLKRSLKTHPVIS